MKVANINTQSLYKTGFLKMLDSFEKSDKLVIWSVILSFICAFLVLLVWRLNSFNLPPQLPLFYSLPWGEQQLIALQQFIIVPIVITLVSLFNLLISYHLHPSQILLKRALALNSLVVAILLLITTIKIIYIFI